MKKRFTEEQIIKALGRLAGGIAAKDLSREMGVSQQTLYAWKRKYDGMDVSEAVRLRQLEAENARLKRAVADLTLDNIMLKEVNSKKW
jgi:putative transposase